MLTDAGKNLVAQALRDGSDIKIRYVALGDSATVPTAADIKLGNELFRKPITQYIDNGTGDAQTICYIAPFEATSADFTIQEIGVFAGTSATGKANSGVLIARWLYNRAKTNLESLQITRDDIFS